MMRTLLLTAAISLVPVAAQAQSCPEPLASARRLVLVTSGATWTPAARIQRFERDTPMAAWRAIGQSEPALIGREGMAWAYHFREFARSAEGIKVDGDKKAPAGFFKIGSAFGFSPTQRPNYLHIKEGTVCVDDPSSPAYNTITHRRDIGSRVRGENMWRVPEYRRGLLVDYPTNASVKAGSCIFIHATVPGKTGTAGCVALPEQSVASLQDFAAPGAVLAILPAAALNRFDGCLPAN